VIPNAISYDRWLELVHNCPSEPMDRKLKRSITRCHSRSRQELNQLTVSLLTFVWSILGWRSHGLEAIRLKRKTHCVFELRASICFSPTAWFSTHNGDVVYRTARASHSTTHNNLPLPWCGIPKINHSYNTSIKFETISDTGIFQGYSNDKKNVKS